MLAAAAPAGGALVGALITAHIVAPYLEAAITFVLAESWLQLQPKILGDESKGGRLRMSRLNANVLVAGQLDYEGRDLAHAVGVEQKHPRPPCGRLRLHARVKALLTSGTLGLRWNQDGREIQLIHQVQQ